MSDNSIEIKCGSFDTPNANGTIYPSKGMSADLDGDALSGYDQHAADMLQKLSNCAAEDYRTLRELETFEEKLEFISNNADFNRSKFNRMSRRRKKIFIAGFTHYDIRTGQLVHRKRNKELFVQPAPVIMLWTETESKPMTNMMNAWLAHLVS